MAKRPRNHPRKDWFHKPREERRRWSFLDEVKPAFIPFSSNETNFESLFIEQGVRNLKDYFFK